MTSIAIILGILGSLLLGAMSPGPSFVLVSRTALESSRLCGVATAAGMGVGGFVFSVLALFGLVAVLQQVEWLYVLLRVLGGVYLIYLACKIWLGAKKPITLDVASSATKLSAWQYFFLGLFTQVANPKTAVVYASIFAVFLPSNPSILFLLILPPAVFLIEAGWYSMIALLLSSEKPQLLYLRGKKWIDRCAGIVLGVLGAKLVSDVVR